MTKQQIKYDYLPVEPSDLGEGPLWHPKRKSLFWFDINAFKMHSWEGGKLETWVFSEPVSAAGWIDNNSLIVASASSLIKFSLITGSKETLVSLESDMPHTRSNDGRGDPWGGFWIGTMGRRAELNAGSIYRFYNGELRQLHKNITIPNSICFSPNQECGYFADTKQKIIWKQQLDSITGWPLGEPSIFVDLRDQELKPDGSVCDSEGYLWNAQFGASRLARYDNNGVLDRVIDLPVSQITCPAFGGESYNTIYATTALEGLNINDLKEQTLAGRLFYFQSEVAGFAEYQVKI
jgi:sugar lactone lactonase YvrE